MYSLIYRVVHIFAKRVENIIVKQRDKTRPVYERRADMQASKPVYYINPCDSHPIGSLTGLITARMPAGTVPVVLCIGSDRLTGDCLGPITGSRLQGIFGSRLNVYGTLEKPVHALNLHEIVSEINSLYSDPYIIAVDACLGTHIGSVTLSEGSIIPGAGVNRCLAAVGQLSITGIVGSCHGNTLNNLSTVRLNSVMNLSYIISEALAGSLGRVIDMSGDICRSSRTDMKV